MSILLGHQIKAAVASGDIFAEPYNEDNVSINSIDVTLSNKLVTYQKLDRILDNYGNYRVRMHHNVLEHNCLDMKKDNKTYELEIPEEGIILEPGILYLGSTNEKVGSCRFVPMYEGRSSMARLGIQSHISAGFGDLGFQSNWTLEINLVHPVKIYPNIRIGQVFFHEVELPEGGVDCYKGKYNEQSGPQSSKSYLDFKKEDINE